MSPSRTGQRGLVVLASPRTPERVVWAPVSAALAALARHAARQERLTA
jgi:hypothetical protein